MVKSKLRKLDRENAGLIFCSLLYGTFLIYLWNIILRRDPIEFSTVIVITIFSIVLLWLLATQFINRRSLLTFRNLGEGVLLFALLVSFYGLIVLIFGVTPTKYYQKPIERAASIDYFIISGWLLLVGTISFYLGKIFDRKEE